jgi:hypothetical protein
MDPGTAFILGVIAGIIMLRCADLSRAYELEDERRGG